MTRLPQTEAETIRASVVEMRRLVETEAMRYLRPEAHSLLCLLVIMCERLVPMMEQVQDMQRRMDRMRGMPEGEEE